MNHNESSYEETVRTMINRENDLIHYRVTWLMTVQGLFFAALGLAWNKPDISSFIALLCFLGILMSVVVLIALAGASRAIRRLIGWWDTNKPSHYQGPDVVGIRPMRTKYFGWIGPWGIIPFLFIIAWTVVFLAY
ncbi:MAG: hypothetical protein WC539_06875 [Nitrospirota bacterium]